MNRISKLFVAAALAAFFVAPAQAQNAGTVTANAFAVGSGPGVDGFLSVLCTQAQIAIGQNAAKPICAALSGDVTMTAAGVTAIGASKVTNSQLATMAANTTKCNATAGTANPTDCNASTMRTNIGVVIGTNVEAWDADLDCLAALSSTGVLSRTGAGTCSAGALALSGLATGTQDTVIGYFGSTTASATAISNCTGALTYSTSTHTFGCNAAAGTGTVTSVVCGTNLAGGTITTTGQCDLDQTAWTSFSGTVSASCSGGTFTVNTARYKNWGKTVFWEMDLTVASGSCTSGNMSFNVPFTAQSGGGGSGFEFVTNGVAVPCWIQASNVQILCRNTVAFASTSRFAVSGVFERQ
ncbi:hypothetical protein [Bradyrhizobium sp. P5_C12]